MPNDSDDAIARGPDQADPVQSGEVAVAGNGGSSDRRRGSSIRALGGGANLSEVELNDEHISTLLELRGREIDNGNRQAERVSDAEKDTRWMVFALIIIAVIVVAAGTAFLVIYKETGLLGYILSGVSGLVAGGIGGYGYGNRRR